MTKHKGKIIISAVLVVIIVVSVVFLWDYYSKKSQGEKGYTEIQKQAVTQENEVISPSEPAASYEDVPVVDFDELADTNTDIYAWIRIPGTLVDYPVVQNLSSENPYDDYYLNHTVERVEGYPGSIYSEPCNATDFSNPNTVIYGHNMKDKTMFASLHNYMDESYFKENKYVYIVTSDKTYVYEIFAAVTYDNRHIMQAFDFSMADSYEEFLTSLHEGRSMTDNFREDVNVTPQDKILTLSTCIANQDTQRYIVEAVLIDVL